MPKRILLGLAASASIVANCNADPAISPAELRAQILANACVAKQIPELDDFISPAGVIAHGAALACNDEIYAYSLAMAGRLHEGPGFAARVTQEAESGDIYVNLVLRSRVEARQKERK
jgi:hypothetical protein